MKNLWMIILLALCINIAGFGQERELAREFVKKSVENIAFGLPKDVGLFQLYSINLTGEELVCEMRFNEEDKPFDDYIPRLPEFAQLISYAFSISPYREAAYNTRLVFLGMKCGKKQEFLFSEEEIISMNPLSTQTFIKREIVSYREKLPIEISKEVSLVDVILEDDTFVFVYNMSESLIHTIQSDEESMKYIRFKELSSDIANYFFIKNLVDANLGLAYRYKSTSSSLSHTLRLTVDDEKKILIKILTDRIANGYEWVDLGLASGTKWASCNVGASKPEQYGDYFAWAETKPKASYRNDNVAYGTDKRANHFSKYVSAEKRKVWKGEGPVDNKLTLDMTDDAARQNMGGEWHIPTMEQAVELWQQCKWTESSQGGVNGALVTGPNGNSIFLPAAGFRYDMGTEWEGTRYCTSTVIDYDPTFVHVFSLYYGSLVWAPRSFGLPVRAVLD